ncbi:thioredoxin [Caldiplasma sukawensis]
MESNEDNELDQIRRKMVQNLLQDSKKKEVKYMEPMELTDGNFMDAVKREKVLVVDFWAAWCAPCRFLSPIIDELSKEYAGKITFGKVNVDENPNVSSELNITSIPTVMMFKNGKLADISIGAVPKPMLEAKLKKLLN